MLENLSYIYKAMYALDLYDSLTNFMGAARVALAVGWLIAHVIALVITTEVDDTWMKFWNATKFYQKCSIAIIIIFSLISVITPSKNTVKAYIGVKAVQAVGEYLDKETDIPERSKATLTKLWDKIDGYIEPIDVENEVDKATDAVLDKTDSIKSKTDSLYQKVNESAGKENVKALVDAVKQQAIDSVIATIKK